MLNFEYIDVFKTPQTSNEFGEAGPSTSAEQDETRRVFHWAKERFSL
jgi:hypothetical protein